MKLPSLEQFTKKALAGDYSSEEIGDIRESLLDKIEKNKEEARDLKKYQEYLNIVEKTLSDSVDSENINSGIVFDEESTEEVVEDIKVM